MLTNYSQERNEMSETIQKEENAENVETPEQDQPAEQSTSEIVEVEWNEIEEVFDLKRTLSETEEYTSQFLLNYEKSKQRLFLRMETIENALFEAARRVKQQKSIPPELTYELKLPQSPGEKAYFIRKDEPR